MRRILAISASSRSWGNCEISAKRALLSAMERGVQVDFVRLTDIRIEPCRGCFKCLSGTGACALEDELENLLGRTEAADALVLAAPVYFGLPPAALVALLDRLLVMAEREERRGSRRPAVTVTVMGNRKWRGVAEPLVNLTASLLGFDIVRSLGLVAEGPAEVLADRAALRSLDEAGERLAAGSAGEGPPGLEAAGAEPRLCPTCRSDFFRVANDSIECPICGQRGELAAYLEGGSFVALESQPRWGRAWLKGHVASWIKPSVERYKSKRRQALKDLAELKRLYAAREREERAV